MARKTIKQRIALDGGKEVEAQLKQLGAAGEKAFDQIRSAASKASFERFGQSLDAFSKNMQTTGRRLALAFAGLTTATTAVAAGIATVAKSGADAADAAGKAAQSAGLQIDAYGRLSFAAEQAGISSEQFGAAMSRLNKEIGAAATGGKSAQEKFSALGVSIRDAQGRLKPTERIVQELAEVFSKMPDGARKSAAAIELFGKSGAQLLPFLDAGKQGLIDLGVQAERLGIVFTAEQAKIGDAMGDALDEVTAAANGMKNQIGLLFAPTITAAAERFRDVLVQNREAILSFVRNIADAALPIVTDFISALAGDDADVKNIWVLEWRDALIDFGRSAQTAVTDIFVPAMQALKKVLDTAAEGLRIFTGINVDGTTLAIAIGVGQAVGAFRLLYSAIVVAISGLQLLAAHPVIGVITAIGAGIALWAARTDSATAAMQKHEGVVGRVEEAYRKAGFEVAKMTREVRDRLLLEARNALKGTEEALSSAMSQLKSELLILSKQEGIGPIVEQFIRGEKTVEEFTAAVAKFGLNNPELAQDAQTILDWANNVEQLSQKSREGKDQIALLEGRMSDAAFKAKYFAEQQQAVATATAEAGKQTAETTKKVEQLGKTITVHGQDGGKPVQKVFDLSKGIGEAAETSKQSLDDMSQSAAAAGEKIGQVKDDVSSLIVSVPEELKGQPTAADALTAGLDQAPAVAKAAADAVVAEIGRVPAAVNGALAGGVKPAEGGEGGEQPQATTGIAETLAKPFEEARDRISAALTAVPVAVSAALTAVQTSAGEFGSGLGEQIAAPFETAATLIAKILERMTTAVRSQFDAMLSAVRSMTAQLQSAVATLEQLAARAEAAAARARAAQSDTGVQRANGGPVGDRFAGGGKVSGPGTGTSDSIMARLSNGEFVLRTAAVRKYGTDLLYALNGLRLPKGFFKRMGFATGGLVSALPNALSRLTDGMVAPSLVPAFADGGAVATSGGRPVNLTFDGQTYQMIAPEDVADRLAKHQGRQGLRKTGKKPSWR